MRWGATNYLMIIIKDRNYQQIKDVVTVFLPYYGNGPLPPAPRAGLFSTAQGLDFNTSLLFLADSSASARSQLSNADRLRLRSKTTVLRRWDRKVGVLFKEDRVVDAYHETHTHIRARAHARTPHPTPAPSNTFHPNTQSQHSIISIHLKRTVAPERERETKRQRQTYTETRGGLTGEGAMCDRDV